MVLFKVPVEEKVPEPPKAVKKPEAAVVPPKEEPTKKEKGTFIFHSLFFELLFLLLSSESVHVLNKQGYAKQITMIHFNYYTFLSDQD